jgi:hypothetical protein
MAWARKDALYHTKTIRIDTKLTAAGSPQSDAYTRVSRPAQIHLATAKKAPTLRQGPRKRLDLLLGGGTGPTGDTCRQLGTLFTEATSREASEVLWHGYGAGSATLGVFKLGRKARGPMPCAPDRIREPQKGSRLGHEHTK